MSESITIGEALVERIEQSLALRRVIIDHPNGEGFPSELAGSFEELDPELSPSRRIQARLDLCNEYIENNPSARGIEAVQAYQARLQAALPHILKHEAATSVLLSHGVRKNDKILRQANAIAKNMAGYSDATAQEIMRRLRSVTTVDELREVVSEIRSIDRQLITFSKQFQKLADKWRDAKIERLNLERDLQALGYDIHSEEFKEIIRTGEIPDTLRATNREAIPLLKAAIKNERIVQDIGKKIDLLKGDPRFQSIASFVENEVAHIWAGVEKAVTEHGASLHLEAGGAVVESTKLAETAAEKESWASKIGKTIKEKPGKSAAIAAGAAVVIGGGAWALNEMGKRQETRDPFTQR